MTAPTLDAVLKEMERHVYASDQRNRMILGDRGIANNPALFMPVMAHMYDLQHTIPRLVKALRYALPFADEHGARHTEKIAAILRGED